MILFLPMDLNLTLKAVLTGAVVYKAYCYFDANPDNYNMHVGAGVAAAGLVYFYALQPPIISQISNAIV